MARRKGTPKTGGRKKGTPNAITKDVQALVDQVFARVNPVEKLCALLNKPMDAGVEARVLLRLMEYKYGQPVQTMKVESGVKFSVGALAESSAAGKNASSSGSALVN